MNNNEINKQLQELKAENKHLNDLLNNALKEKEQLEIENEELKKEIEEIREDCDCCFNTPTILEQLYKQCLDEIEKYCKEQNLKYDTTACDILRKIKEVNE